MGSGLPDWYRGVDVAFQNLAQLIIRPKYGGAKRNLPTGAVDPGVPTPLVSIGGKGVIYGSYFYLIATGVVDNDYLYITIDGVETSLPTFGEFKDYNYSMISAPGGSISIYDEVNNIYGGFAGIGATFESSLVMAYIETYGRTPDATLYLYYALLAV